MEELAKSKIRRLIKSPYMIFIGLAIGFYIGIFHKSTGKVLEPFGQIYLAALQMSIIPLVFVSVSTSIANLLSAHQAPAFLKHMMKVFIPLLILSSFIGMIFAMVMKPG
ncbi:MAG: cation:dicarboxylate symporter family transporter [Candidatus Nucleicultricaceae bacterium]